MARYRGSGKATCEGCLWIDVTLWHRQGRLKPGLWFSSSWTRGGEPCGSISVQTEAGAVVLSFRHQPWGEEWQEKRQRVCLTSTGCNYGGNRPWFLCPACNRRVGKLYFSGGPIWACRCCYGLAYESQQEPIRARGLSKAQRLRTRLGGDPGWGALIPEKPKGMHWRTYERIVNAIYEAEEHADAVLALWLGRVTKP